MYEVEKIIARTIKSFYKESEACLRMGREEGEWVKVGLKQKGVMAT